MESIPRRAFIDPTTLVRPAAQTETADIHARCLQILNDDVEGQRAARRDAPDSAELYAHAVARLVAQQVKELLRDDSQDYDGSTLVADYLGEISEALRTDGRFQPLELNEICRAAITEAESELVRAGLITDAADDDALGISPIIQRLSEVTAEQVSWLVCGEYLPRLPRGKLSLISGAPDLGKSFLTIAYACSLERQGLSTLLVCCEDGISDTVKPRLAAMGGSGEHVYVTTVFRDAEGEEQLLNFAEVEAIRATVKACNPALVCIDPLTSFVGQTNTYQDSAVRNLLGPVVRLAEESNFALVLVRHSTKSLGERAGALAGAGSIAFSGLARQELLVTKHPTETDSQILWHVKCNLAPKEAPRQYTLSGDGVRFGDVVEGVTLEEALQPPARGNGNDDSALKYAIQWVLDILENGPVAKQKLQSRAGQEGISTSTFKRTAEKLKRDGLITGSWQGRVMYWRISDSKNDVQLPQLPQLPQPPHGEAVGVVGAVDGQNANGAQQPCATDTQSDGTLHLPMKVVPADVSDSIYEFRRAEPSNAHDFGKYMTFCAKRHLPSQPYYMFGRTHDDA